MKLTNEEKCVYCREYGNIPCDECEKKLEEKKAMDKKEELKGQLKFNPMNIFPKKVEGEYFSKTVLVYDKDLDDVDLGFYNFDTQKWYVMGDFQMDLICWSYIPMPHELQLSDYQSYLTE